MRLSNNKKLTQPLGRSLTGKLGTIAILLIVLTLGSSAVFAGALSSARSLAMGGTSIAWANGVDAAKFNPANLGLTDYRRSGIEVIGAGIVFKNNSFTLDDYNLYNGALLTDQDKTDILDKIPTEGLQLLADVDATLMSMAFGSFAVSFGAVGVADINLSKDIVDLVFNGNTFADTISLDGSASDGYSYASVGLSYGMPVYNSGSRQLSVGATVKYLKGIASEHLVELHGDLATFATGYSGSGQMVAQTATGGKGFALDLGASLRLNKNYTAGVRVENFLGSITWDVDPEEHGYLFEFDTMTVDNSGEDYVTSEEYTIPIGSYSTSLPAVVTFGFAKTSGKLLWAVDWEQGLEKKPGASTKPLIKAGFEYSLVSFLPLRAGFQSGGNMNSSFSFGSGLNFGPFYFDMGMATGASLSGGSSKGANLALSMGLVF